MTTIQEPIYLFEVLKNSKRNVTVEDTQNELLPFLKEQYNYEVNREPKHRLFTENYDINYFCSTNMLNYYLNPTKENSKKYVVEEHNPDYFGVLIHSYI